MPEPQPRREFASKASWKNCPNSVTRTAAILTAVLVSGLLTSCSNFPDAKQTEEYRCAIDIVRKSAEVRERLGEPLDESASSTATVSDDKKERAVTMIVPISGPKGSGKFNVTAVRSKRDSDLIVSFEHNDDVIALYTGPYPCK